MRGYIFKPTILVVRSALCNLGDTALGGSFIARTLVVVVQQSKLLANETGWNATGQNKI